MLKPYLKEIFQIAQQGDAREESYYSPLEVLISEYAKSIGKKNIHITILPKKTDAGNPDFRVWDGKQHIVGYIEAKSPTVENLDPIEKTQQLERYRHTFPNLILTNFLEFRLYRNGTLVDEVPFGIPFHLHKPKTATKVEKEPDFFNLLEKFFSFSLPKVYDAKTLAVELARRTRFLKEEVVAQELKEEQEEAKKGFILGFYEAFRRYLIGGLTKEDFADLYSQTITYALFAARTRSENGFNRKLAYDRIPHTIGILRDVFQFISLGDLPQQMEWIIDDISEVLAVTDVKNILHQYFHEGKGKDPIVHFYETFLAEYDPKKRKVRGVYYTPEAVVSYIVVSLNSILKEHFARKDGFASESITVLDPAAGTLTFLAEATKLALKEFISEYGEGGKDNFIKEHILKKNFYAFELMMAPYAVGHLKMSFLLEELGYKLQEDDRFNLYLTSTLEMDELAETELPGMVSLSEESHRAGKVKKEIPILVILGNPPYSGHSANASQKVITIFTKKGKEKKKKIKTWIGGLIDDYKVVDGKPLGEKNPKWLQDDYVKFIRFAQWKIDQSGEGVLGFITNHSYLDNPTFRGMRQSLMNSFDQIYILDLHGSTQSKKKSPDGSKDQNVFDIKQGVAIALFIKKKGGLVPSEKPGERRHDCRVFHSEIWGLREKKYRWLFENNIRTTKWQEIFPKSEFYLFTPRDEGLCEHYKSYLTIKDIFDSNCLGIQTHRDDFVIAVNKEDLRTRIMAFRNLSLNDESIARSYHLKAKINGKKLSDVREELNNDENWESYFQNILYRPFDVRSIFYSHLLIDRPRTEVMRHMTEENIGLLLPRRANDWHHAFVSQHMPVDIAISTASREANYLFPLYLYPNKEKKDLFSHAQGQQKKEPNINSKLFTVLDMSYKKKPNAEEIFHYIYAVLYSNIYRGKYSDLKIDFPRIPFTKDYKLFIRMAGFGKRLADLHLLNSSQLDPPIARFQGKGNYNVKKVGYQKERVYINNDQYFEGIKREVWEYQIGGYQVCDRWLKDRKEKKGRVGRPLSLDGIKQYCRIVTSLQKTIEIQKLIDEIYPEVEKETIEFVN